jgi:hypothetical protein
VVFVSTGLAARDQAAGPAAGHIFKGHGVSFQYPSTIQRLDFPVKKTKSLLWQEVFGVSGSKSAIVVEAFRSVTVTRANVGKLRGVFRKNYAKTAAASGGRLTAGPTVIGMGGLPGYRFEVSYPSHRGAVWITAWRNSTQYFLNCQYRELDATAIKGACGLIRASFHAAARPKVFRQHGVVFRYPAELTPLKPSPATRPAGVLWQQILGLPGTKNVVALQALHSVDVNWGNIASLRESFRRGYARVARQSGGRLVRGPVTTAMAGLPGFRFEVSFARGRAATWITAWRHTTQYFLNCEYLRSTPEGRRTMGACSQIRRTFRLA